MNRSYRTLWLIVALLASPVVIAASLYFSGWMPGGKPAGALLQPPQPLPVSITQQLAPDQWHLVVATPGRCDETCLHLLDETRRIQVALYKQMPRVSRLWLSADVTDSKADSARLHALQPDLTIAAAPLPAQDGAPQLYLLDPKGRLVLRYSTDAAPKGILKDLERLLRYS